MLSYLKLTLRKGHLPKLASAKSRYLCRAYLWSKKMIFATGIFPQKPFGAYKL